MEKINFENLPSTNTPINATNLNQLQTNVENAINGVVESGSNENGSWIKFDDGTMICRNTIQGDAEEGSLADYWEFCNKTNLIQVTFPQEFTQVDNVSLTNWEYGGCFSTALQTVSNNGFDFIALKAKSVGMLSYKISYDAYGRWK